MQLNLKLQNIKKIGIKNHPDFDNKKTTAINNTDYFRKYLWKEREVNNYTINTIMVGPVTYNGVLRRFVVDVIINYHTNLKLVIVFYLLNQRVQLFQVKNMLF